MEECEESLPCACSARDGSSMAVHPACAYAWIAREGVARGITKDARGLLTCSVCARPYMNGDLFHQVSFVLKQSVLSEPLIPLLLLAATTSRTLGWW